MKTERKEVLCLILPLLLGAQSLAEIAREEEARRRRMEDQGIVEKVIDLSSARGMGEENVTPGGPESPPQTASRNSPSSRFRSVHAYRIALQKLDQAIRKQEKLLEAKRERLHAVRFALPRPGPFSASSRNRTADIRVRLEEDIDEIVERSATLRRERAECYDEGKRAGFLPGELDGRGMR